MTYIVVYECAYVVFIIFKLAPGFIIIFVVSSLKFRFIENLALLRGVKLKCYVSIERIYKRAKTLFSLIVHSSKRNNGSKYAQYTDFTGESNKLNL